MKSTILIMLTGLALVAGCSDSGEPGATSSPATTSADTADTADTAESATTAPVPATAADVATTVAASEPESEPAPSTTAQAVIDIENQPGEGTFEGALEDASFTCEPADAGWTASGTVTNPTDAAVGYRIFMSFLDPAGETLALLEVETDLADVGPGEAREWEVGFESDADDLTCVARVERRPAS